MLSHDEPIVNIPKAIDTKSCNHESQSINNSCSNSSHSQFCLKFSFFLIGIGFLFPYNSVVTAVDFFAGIYYDSIDFYLGWLLLAPSMALLCITLKYGYWGSIYQRIIGCFLLEAILTVIIPLVRNSSILFMSTFILGCLSAILQGTLFSLLGFLGSDMMAITQTGIGCSGVVVGIIRILTKIFIPSHIRDSTYLYFLMAIIMVIFDIIIYISILHPSQRVQKAIHQDTLKNDSLHAVKVQKRNKKTMKHNYNESQSILNKDNNNNNYDSINDKKPLIQLNDDEHVKKNDAVDVPLSLWRLFCASWQCQIAVFLNYTLTLSLFPGVMSLMKWDDSGDEWFAVIQIFLFNFFDTIGKNLTTYPWILNLWNRNILLSASLMRLVFIPLFVMCVHPMIFSWQIAIIINGLMGISNGFIGTSGFCLGPMSPNVPTHEKGRTAQMLAVALTAGLVVGASLAFLINLVMTNYL